MKLQTENFEDFKSYNTVEDVLPLLSNVKNISKGRKWTARCPAHSDNRNSLGITRGDNDKLLLHCFAGCSFEEIINTIGVYNPNPRPAPKPKTSKKSNSNGGGSFKVTDEYDYSDEQGKLLYQVLRTDPKGFFQRRPFEDGKWILGLTEGVYAKYPNGNWKLEKEDTPKEYERRTFPAVRRVPYKLPEILARKDETIYVCEGEKDSEIVYDNGLLSTTNAGGAGNWSSEYSEFFKDREVVILAQNDDAGRQHAATVAKSLLNVARSIKIVNLPGLKEKGDVYDWFTNGGTVEKLKEITEATETVTVEEQLEKPLPHLPDAEQIVLGAILLENRHITQVIEHKSLNDFYIPSNKHILRAMITLFNRGDEINPTFLADELKRQGLFEQVGGYDKLSQLTYGIPPLVSIENYLKKIKGKAQLRQLSKIGRALESASLEEVDDADEISNRYAKQIFEVQNNDINEGFTRVFPIVDRVLSKAQDLAGKEGVTGVPTGFYDIDEITSGLQPSDLIIVAGRPSMGKTAVAMNIATNAGAHNNQSVAIFSLEMSKDLLVQRMLCSEARVDLHKFRTGKLSREEWQRLGASMGKINESRIFIDDTAAISVAEMRAKLKRLESQEGNVDLVIVDYLQLMAGGSKRESRQQEVSQISRDLKTIAKEFDVPLIALSQLSRASEQRADHRPTLSDLRDSGSIEQDADVVAFVYREEVYLRTDDNAGLAELIFAKQRNGPTGVVELAWLKEYTRFENLVKLKLGR